MNPNIVRPHSFVSDSTIRSYASFPYSVDVCDKPLCDSDTPTFRRNFPANLTVTAGSIAKVGVSLGALSQLSSVPTTLTMQYTWIGIYPSMTIDPFVYIDGYGQFFNGPLNIKVRARVL